MPTALAVAYLLVSASQFASARTATPRWRYGRSPTIVLEHGTWADGSSGDAGAKQLQMLGFTVDVLPDPLRSLSAYPHNIAWTRRDAVNPARSGFQAACAQQNGDQGP